MAILTKTRYLLAILLGFTTGIIGTVVYTDGTEPEVQIREVEKIVEVEVDEIEGKWDLMKTLKIEFGPISYSLFLRLVAFR